MLLFVGEDLAVKQAIEPCVNIKIMSDLQIIKILDVSMSMSMSLKVSTSKS